MRGKYTIFFFTLFTIPFAIQAQSSDEEIRRMLEEGDYFELNRQYLTLKESANTLHTATAEAFLDILFNKKDKITESAMSCISTYHEELEASTIVSLLNSAATNMIALNQYQEASDMLEALLDGFLSAGISEENLSEIIATYQYASALSKQLPSYISLLEHDCEVPLVRKTAGEGELFYIPACINGIETSMLFDTGISFACYATEAFAQDHNIRIISENTILAGDMTTNNAARLGVADVIQIGDINYHNVVFIIGDGDGAAGVDAILGMNFMEAVGEFQLFPNQNRIVFPAAKTPMPCYGSNMIKNRGLLYVEAYSDCEPFTLHLDTGNTNSFMNASFYRSKKYLIETTGMKDVVNFNGVYGTSQVEIFTLPTLPFEVGGKKIYFGNIDVFTEDVYAKRSDGNFGVDFFKKFNKVTINTDDMFLMVE